MPESKQTVEGRKTEGPTVRPVVEVVLPQTYTDRGEAWLAAWSICGARPKKETKNANGDDKANRPHICRCTLKTTSANKGQVEENKCLLHKMKVFANSPSIDGDAYLTLSQAWVANNENVRVASRGHLAVPARASEQPQYQTGL